MVKSILEEANYSDIWLAKGVPNQDSFIKSLRTRLQNNHDDMIKRLMFNDNRPNNKGQNKLRTYRTFKTDHMQEKYLHIIKDSKVRSAVTKLRLSAHHLMIEKGRQLRINLEDRLCTKCNQNMVENELHAVMNGSAYKSERNDLFNILAKEIKDWNNLSTTNRFIQIMKITIQVIKTGQFIHHIINFDSANKP